MKIHKFLIPLLAKFWVNHWQYKLTVRLLSFVNMVYKQIIQTCILLVCFFSWVNIQAQPDLSDLKDLKPKTIIGTLELSSKQKIQMLNFQIFAYKKSLYRRYSQQLNTTVQALNQLRDPYYQQRILEVARRFEGRNIYHNYGWLGRNDETNTCVNAWCQVVAETGVPQLRALTHGRIRMYPRTIAKEKQKRKPNLYQKIPKYINVGELLADLEKYGFLPIDLDFAQRGDICVQYYRKYRMRDEFTAQHLSIVDQVIRWDDGRLELRDWHEGIAGLPYVYRTGTNLASSYNNVFLPENIYFGYQNELGKERPLTGRNPNVCQAYAYFGNNVDKAWALIAEINYLRGQLDLLEQLSEDYSRGVKVITPR